MCNHFMIDILSQVSTERLEDYVRKIAGLRHGTDNYGALEQRASFIEETLRSVNLPVENQEVPFHGKTYRNLIAALKGADNEKECLLIGAHYDSASGSTGADDNASGTAVLLETAGILSRQKLRRPLQFVAFTLEEPQPRTVHFLIGSSHFAAEAKRAKKEYEAVLILESVGYTDNAEGSQIVPFLVGIQVPKKGNFLGVVSNRRSRSLMHAFQAASNKYVPELPVVPYEVPLSGRIIPATRFSDHTPFWNHGYPAVMLTDTAMFRNPHYHTYHDSPETLDFPFMTNVAKAVISAVLKLDNSSSGG